MRLKVFCTVFQLCDIVMLCDNFNFNLKWFAKIYLFQIKKMSTISSVQVPAYEFHFNLVVYPLPTSERKVRTWNIISVHCLILYLFRASVTFMYWEIIVWSQRQLEGLIGWSFCLIMSTASCHLIFQKELCTSMTKFLIVSQILCTAWRLTQ